MNPVDAVGQRSEGRASRTLEVPAVLLGVGEFGTQVAQRLRDERDQALVLDGFDPRHDDGLGLVRVELAHIPERGAERGTSSPAAGTLTVPEQAAEDVLGAVRRALAHARMVGVRDGTATEHQTRLTILVFADLGEAEVRNQLWPILARVQARLLAELGPIFEAYRTGKARNGVILPLLTMPHPPAVRGAEQVRAAQSQTAGPDATDTTEGAETKPDAAQAIVDCVRQLCRSVADTPARRRAVSQLYLIEDVAEFSVLSREELGQCVRNFATMLLYADLSAEGGAELITSLLHGSQPKEPLATFVCSVAELPRARLAAYGRDRVALEALDAVRDAPRVDASFSEADALEQIEALAMERGERAKEAEKDVRAVLERYAPAVTPDPPLPWYERGDLLTARYGPDHGDPSLLDPTPPAPVPAGWLAERMRAIEDTWRLLQRKRFDDVVARDRAAVERWRDELLSTLRKRVDRELWADPAPQSLRRTEELVSKLRRAFGEQLDEAVRDRDRARPAPPPDFEALRQAHAACLDAARHKPDPPRMLLWGILIVIAALVFLPAVLAMFADAIAMDTGHWFEPLFRRGGRWTALAIGALGSGAWLGWTLGRAHLRVLEASEAMWTALTDTITGERGSLLEYFTTRLRLSRAIARVESLLAVTAALDADAETLLLMDKAARRAQSELLEHLRDLGVRLPNDRTRGGRDDLEGLLGILPAGDSAGPSPEETLVEPFVGPEGARALSTALVPEGRESRVHDILARLGEHYGRNDRWREELPFADIERLRRAAEPHAEPIARWDPFAGAERAMATAARLATFVRRQRRTLRGALNFSGYEDLDADGVSRPFSRDGQAVIPRAAVELVRERAGADAEHLSIRPGIEPDRAYYIVAVSGIAEASVASLTSLEAPRSEKPSQ